MTDSILIDDPPICFEPYEPDSEDTYARHILRAAPRIFPQYHAARWSPLIRDGQGRGAQPDMVLLSKTFDEWHVVEIELSKHSPRGHVAPQLETLSDGFYGPDLLESLVAAMPTASDDRLRELLYRRPGFLCVFDGYTDRMHRVCRNYDFEMAVAEPYVGTPASWAVHITRMPAQFQAPLTPRRITIRLVKRFGDKLWIELPQHLKHWTGAVTVVDTVGSTQQCQCVSGCILLSPETAQQAPAGALVVESIENRTLRLEAAE